MERPKVEVTAKGREITGEIMYLDEARRRGFAPENYDDLSDMAIQMYETEADMAKAHGARPAILDEYEAYDKGLSPLGASCAAMAEELLELKRPDSPFTFEDFVVEMSPQEVLAKLKSIRAGEILAGDDEQLAIPSDGEYYPILDIKKNDMSLTGVGLRVFGWKDDHKYIFTNEPGQKYSYPQDCLQYPSTEKSKWYSFELVFSYQHAEAGQVNEELSLYIGQRGHVEVNRHIWVSAYAETGYEGHNGRRLEGASGEDSAVFADLIAEIVGDEPESVWMRQDRLYAELLDQSGEQTRAMLEEICAKTHPGQVMYYASLRLTMPDGTQTTVRRMIRDGVADDVIVHVLRQIAQPQGQ